MKRLRIGVIYGGRSSEHEVSLASASAIIANLSSERYEPIPIYVSKHGSWHLERKPPETASAAALIKLSKAGQELTNSIRSNQELHFLANPTVPPLLTIQPETEKVVEGKKRAIIESLDLDIVFPILHGPHGEDGTLQGLLELANIPYVGAGVLASAVGMDKAMSKTLFVACGLPVVEYVTIRTAQWEEDRESTLEDLYNKLTPPFFVKPVNLGSSVGISKTTNRIELERGIDLAQQFDRKIIVETAVTNTRELECAILGNDSPAASVVGEVLPVGEFYDYESKYVDDGSTLTIPASLRPEQSENIRKMALKAFRAIEAEGMARVDFLMDKDTEKIYINEVNTIPGFTTISMYAKLWKASGLNYSQLLDRLITLALERYAETQDRRTSSI